MGALFARKPIGPHTDLDAVELALDLTSEAVTVYERSWHGGWRKFASAPLDDPEFSIVIGLLRTEAESRAGGPRPARLWLPGEQVLTLRARIKEDSLDERWQAAFDYIDRETIYQRDEVAVAISKPDPKGETTLLIAFAETWHEARTYASRWGFTPGAVSTRHTAADFGSEGPVFHLNTPMKTPSAALAATRRSRLTIAALAVTIIAAGSAVWTLRPWDPQTNPTAPGATVEVSKAPPIDQPPKTATADPMPAPVAEVLTDPVPPEHFPNILVMSPPGATDFPPAFDPALMAFEIPAAPNAPTAPAPLGSAPLPLPDPEPAPLERDTVAAWMGPFPDTQPGKLSSPLAAKELSKVTEPPLRIEKVALLSNGKIPPQQPFAAPKIEPPQPEPVSPETDAMAPAESVAPSESTVAPLVVPMPPPRLARVDPVTVKADAVEPLSPLAMILPPPRPAGWGKPVLQDQPAPIAAIPTEIAPVAPAEVPNLATLTPAEAQKLAPVAPTEVPNLAAPTKFASLSSPMPRTRPAVPAIPRNLPAIAALPALTGTTKQSIRSAASEQGLPLDSTALIGILNLDNGRKALLRFPNGRYRSVVVGDELDGWRVSIIGVDAIRVTRAGEDRTLLLVNR